MPVVSVTKRCQILGQGHPTYTSETSRAGSAGNRKLSRPRSERDSHDLLKHEVADQRSEEHTSELQSPCNLVCRLLLEKKKKNNRTRTILTSVTLARTTRR